MFLNNINKAIISNFPPLFIGILIFSLTLVMIGSAWTGPSQSPTGGNPIHYCSTQADITEALADIGSGAGTIVLKSGTIALSSTINISGGGSYIIEGQGDKTVIDCNGDRTAFNITSAASCVLRDFKIDAQDLTTSDRIIVNINNVDRVVVDNVKFFGNEGRPGIGIKVQDADGVYVSNCGFFKLTDGLYLNNAKECNIINNRMSEIGNEFPTTGIHLSNNSSYNTVAYNVFTSMASQAVYVDSGGHNTINHNIISLNESTGIGIDNSDYNTLSGNIVSQHAYSSGIGLSNANHNSIEGNVSIDNNYGIILANCHNNTIVGNTFNSNNYDGLLLINSSDNSVSGNTVNDNNACHVGESAGIKIINNSDRNTVKGNVCNGNTNICSGSGGYGIDIADSTCDDNTVLGNTLRNNESSYKDAGTNTFDSTITDGDPLNNF